MALDLEFFMLCVIHAECYLRSVTNRPFMLTECRYAECRYAECRGVPLDGEVSVLPLRYRSWSAQRISSLAKEAISQPGANVLKITQ
jgi:hypothetical protein